MEESSADVRDLIDGCVEEGFVGFGGLVEAADLPDELQRRVANLLVGHGRIEVEEIFDVSAHAGIIGKWGAPVRGVQGRWRGLNRAGFQPLFFNGLITWGGAPG